MNSIIKLLISVLAFLALATSAYAQSPREQLNQMVQQLQKTPTDNVLREKIIKLAAGIKPVPEIPEEARRSFIIGEALFKQAKNLRPAYEAAHAFWKAATLAPWWGEAYWNLASAQRLVGQYVGAKESLRLYLLTNPSAEDRRIAQDRLYAIDADTIAATSSAPGGMAGFWQKISYQNHGSSEWIKIDPENPLTLTAYEIRQTGSAIGVKCMRCDSTLGQVTTVNVINSNSNAIAFQVRVASRFLRRDAIMNYECKLDDRVLSCAITDEDGEKFFQNFAKRSVCEIVGEPVLGGVLSSLQIRIIESSGQTTVS